MQPLKVGLAQGATRWHDPAGNRAYYAAMLDALHGCDLIVLPETFTSGFSNEAIHNAETMHGPTLDWMREQAARMGAAVAGSVQLRAAGDDVFNRLLFVTPDGNVSHYDKRHLFRYAGEHERYCAGRDRIVVQWRGWRICPLVCYDLRFPVYSRNRHGPQGMDYDLLLYVANWPAAREYAWHTLLRARAIENLCYCVGLNRVGVDGNGLAYSGDSAVLDFLGRPLVELGSQQQTVSVSLDADALAAHRQHFPAWMDADEFRLLPQA
ncbi:MAG TPA: amidohydrolase [Rudaea sp.]|nr:amidohydrolase [Rudaea sp.]